MAILLVLIPLLSACSLLLAKGMAKSIAVVSSLINLGLTFFFLAQFSNTGGFQFGDDLIWVESLGLHFHYGIDGITLLLLLLTNVLTPIIVLGSFGRKYENEALFYGLILLMNAGLNGVFMSLDGLLFYIFWEITLLPIWFICAIWGGHDRIRITLKFFIYTFAGSLLMLLALIYVYLQTPGIHSFDITALYAVKLTAAEQCWIFWGFFAAFAIKMPVWPFHSWQPDTYTVSPAPGTMLLSGIMLKMGIYGLIRWMMPLAPAALKDSGQIAIWLSIAGIVYAAIIAIRQQDLKRVVAWSSISHVGLIAAGIMTATTAGLQGGMLQMLAHGINVVGLFLVIEMIEQRLNIRDMSLLGGIAKPAPKLAVLFMIIMLGSVAVPLTNGFVGEFLLLNGVFQFGIWAAAIAGLTVIFCAVYMLRIYQLTMFGETNQLTATTPDVNPREFWLLAILCVPVLFFGFYPQPLLDIARNDIENLLKIIAVSN